MALSQQHRTDPDGSSYNEYSQDHEYTYKSGLAVMPVLGATPAHRVLRLHSGFGMRRVSWSAGRTGSPPMLPAMANTSGDTFLGGRVTPVLPNPNEPAAGYNWAVTGEYLYVQNSPRIVGENAFPTGNYPFVVSPQARVASELIGNDVVALVNATSPSVDPTDAVSELISEAVRENFVSGTGVVTWPFTLIPAVASSTHIIA